MKSTKKIMKEITVDDTIRCDICGREFNCNKEDQNINDIMEIQEFISIKSTCGYNSIIGDECEIEIDMCQYCLKEKLGDYLRITFPEF